VRSGIEYSNDQKKARAIRRIAEVIHGHYEEGATGIHSRIFEVLIYDEYVENGQSINGGNYREHVVPCALIRNECLTMYINGKTIADVVNMIDRHLRIVRITPEEARHMDHGLGLKDKMPDGWRFGIDDPLARLHKAGIKLA
jgi:hypothetical protein